MGSYYETINYDYIVGEYAFKFFSFKNKSLDNLIHTAKAWAYTAKEMENKYKTIFVYDIDVDDKKFDTIIKILEESSYKLIKFDETLDFIINRYSNKRSFIKSI